jgi:5'-3' exoribonuclease 1
MSVAATEAPPEIDNLYLDMNGIIHNCTHANDPNLKLTETEMVVRIFTYLDKLIQIIKPQKLVFMAIDGARGAFGRGAGWWLAAVGSAVVAAGLCLTLPLPQTPARTGVAPRAKMNQQRSRRFKSAKEREAVRGCGCFRKSQAVACIHRT